MATDVSPELQWDQAIDLVEKLLAEKTTVVGVVGISRAHSFRPLPCETLPERCVGSNLSTAASESQYNAQWGSSKAELGYGQYTMTAAPGTIDKGMTHTHW